MYNFAFPSKALWAKKSDSAATFKWLPLEQHLLDTNNVINLLWQHWLSEGQRREFMRTLSKTGEDTALKLISFLALTHDLGKATPAFQAKRRGNVWSDLDCNLLENLTGDGFTQLEDLRLTSPGKSPHALAGQVILQQLGVAEDVACIIGSHHGKPANSRKNIKEQILAYEANYYQSDRPGDACAEHWMNIQKSILAWALDQAGFASLEDLPTVSLTGQVLLSGLLIMADWIASNELYFPLIDLTTNEISDQYSRMYKGWTRWFNNKANVFTHKADINQLYTDSFKFSPRPVQEEFAQLVSTIGAPGLIILEAPMGIGKTEMALAAAEQLGCKLGQYGIYFGLPTQATSDGIFERIEAWVGRLGHEELPGHKSIQLVHGKSALNEEYQRLRRKTSNSDAEENGSVSADEWFVGRKTATLDDFVVGTVDHFLMTALKQKHLALRHLGFSKKVVIIDEVHAYDAYMGQYLNRALEWMGAYHVPVIMLSATLPGKQREAFVRSYLQGQDFKSCAIKCPDDLTTITAYPLVTYTNGAEIKQAKDFSPQDDQEFQIIRLAEEDLVTKVTELLADGGVLGLMVNTVKRAQAMFDLFSEVFGSDTVELLHSQFIATDRIAKEKKLLDMIGKDKTRPNKKIIIGTQVIEQSLDIDFDVLISDLAPMDLLLQRIGRLHRHEKVKRPVKLTKPQVFILGTDSAYNFDKGSEFVYGQYLLMRTQYFLPDKILLPADISPLVQKVYGDEALALDQISNEIYHKAKSQHEQKIQQKEYAAKTYRINKPHSRLQKTLIGWLDNVNLYAEECGHAQVRDSDETIEVILVQACGTGYSFVGEEEDISRALDDPAIAQKLARQTITLPRAVTYNLDKTIEELEAYNRKYLAAWQRRPWLKGSLGIILDEQGDFNLGQFCLKYSSSQGLSYQKLNI